MQESSHQTLQRLKTRTIRQPADLYGPAISHVPLYRLTVLSAYPAPRFRSIIHWLKPQEWRPRRACASSLPCVFTISPTQAPCEIWMAGDRKTRLPVNKELPIRYVRFSGPAPSEEIKSLIIDEIPVTIYQPAKTVADCLKYRNKIGLAVVLEALKDCLRNHRCEADIFWRFATICRVSNVMRLYLEAMNT